MPRNSVSGLERSRRHSSRIRLFRYVSLSSAKRPVWKRSAPKLLMMRKPPRLSSVRLTMSARFSWTSPLLRFNRLPMPPMTTPVKTMSPKTNTVSPGLRMIM